VKLFSKFEMKLKGKVLGDDAIHFCLAQSKKRDNNSRNSTKHSKGKYKFSFEEYLGLNLSGNPLTHCPVHGKM
jgi:hypothetical protein